MCKENLYAKVENLEAQLCRCTRQGPKVIPCWYSLPGGKKHPSVLCVFVKTRGRRGGVPSCFNCSETFMKLYMSYRVLSSLEQITVAANCLRLVENMSF